MSLLNGLIDCCSTKGPLIKHNVPVWMSTVHQCYCFLTYPSLPSSPLFPLSCFRARTHFVNVTHHNILHLHLHSPLHPQRRSAFSLFLPLFCPSLAPTIPAPRLPASLQPSPLPLPRSSIVSAWFSSLSLSCSTQPCLALPFYCAARAKRSAHSLPVWAQGRGREALQTADPARKTRQRHWLLSSSTLGCVNLNARWHLSICFFTAETHLSPLPLPSSHSRPLISL